MGPSETMTRKWLGRFDDADGGAAHAVRSVAVASASCCGPMTRVVAIRWDAAKTAS